MNATRGLAVVAIAGAVGFGAIGLAGWGVSSTTGTTSSVVASGASWAEDGHGHGHGHGPGPGPGWGWYGPGYWYGPGIGGCISAAGPWGYVTGTVCF